MDDAPVQGPLPPYRVIRDFLDEEAIARLLDYALRHEAEFEATALESGRIDTSIRVSACLVDFGPMKQELKQKISALVPSLIADLRVTPFVTSKVEAELVAHGDGAFYKRHIDTATGKDTGETVQRMISCVYYFHAEPKAFSGGALRLYAFGTDDSAGRFVDLEPERNTLLVFPSWASHSVRPVACPSRRFVDSRFAINCWANRLSPGS